MKLKVYTIQSESFRYGDTEGFVLKRFSTPELRDSEFDKETAEMRGIEDLTEYEPNSFEDSIHKWAYDYKKLDEVIEIHEKEEGEFLNQLLVESRREKIEKIKNV